ncbi:UNVERIFIED_CONTAM: hypothetical protein GTU68_019757 [Idotea baltica]|nr:hypothetical protein [Idotea baltica]
MNTTPETEILTDTQAAADLLRQGKLLAFATETVYGLGADATNSVAVAAVFEAKKRPAFDPLIVHVPDVASAKEVATEWPAMAEKLAAEFWPGPLTMVLPKRAHISDLVTSGLPGVGIRIPAHPLARQLLLDFGGPVVAPSANLFGAISPTSADHVLQGLNGRIAAVLDGGSCDVGVESTVISLMNDRPVILRPGGLPKEDLERITGPIGIAKANSELNDEAQPAPGMLSRHYAPATRMVLIEIEDHAIPMPNGRSGLLTYRRPSHVNSDGDDSDFDECRQLGMVDDLKTCASGFFAALRSLDAAGLDVIIARKFPTHGLGIALNDRLKRAAAR